MRNSFQTDTFGKNSDMSIEIRKVQEADFPQLIALFQEFAEFQKTPDRMTNSLEQMQQEKDFFEAFVAVNEEGKVVGYSSWFFTYHTWVGKSLYMDDLYVSPAYRGTGLGQRLFDSVHQIAQEGSCNRMRWLVSDWNINAQEFYKKIGATLDHTEMHCELVIK
ncbi:MAG: GNAT family N-acetyltransferase [Roseivirga sp.]